jgi:hypothetical protein
MRTRTKGITIQELRYTRTGCSTEIARLSHEIDLARGNMAKQAALIALKHRQVDRRKGVNDDILAAEKEIKQLNRSYKQKPYSKGRK